MAITVSGFLNTLVFILTGEHFLQANEDVAYDKSLRIAELKTGVSTLKGLAKNAVHTIGTGFPPGVAEEFTKAINEVLPYLDQFEADLEQSRQGQLQISMQIREAKWNIIAELIRLAAELAVLSALSFFTGGLSATHAATAKMVSRIRILTIMLELLNRLKVIPSLTEAAEEAFTTLAVRLAMMTVAPTGQRPKNIDWKEVGISGLFGAGVGFFQPILSKAFNNVAHHVVKNRKDPFPELGNKFNKKTDGSKKHGGDDATHHHGDTPEPHTTSNKNNQTPHQSTAQRIAQQVAEFNAEGLSEFLVEPFINGIFYGNWQLNWQTYLGAGLSERAEEGLHHLSTSGAKALKSKLNLTSLNLAGAPNRVNALAPQGGGTDTAGGDGQRSGGREPSPHGVPSSATATPVTTRSSPVNPGPLTSSPLPSSIVTPPVAPPENGTGQATTPHAVASTAPTAVSPSGSGRSTPDPTGPQPSGSPPTPTPTPTQTTNDVRTDGPKTPAPVPTGSAQNVARPAPPPARTAAGSHTAPTSNGQGASDPAPHPRTTESAPARSVTASPPPRRTDTESTDDSALGLAPHTHSARQPGPLEGGHDDRSSGYDSGYESDPSEPAGNPHDDTVPVAYHDVAQRQWIARQVTADDLPDLSGVRIDGSVHKADLAAAGITLSPEQEAQAMMSGGRLPLSGSGLTPADQVKALMLRPGPWPQALDVTAGNTTRRIWQEAYADFAQSVPDSAKEAAPHAWDAATALVLPSSPGPGPGNSGHTPGTYHDAVRQVADLLVTGDSQAQAAALADHLRQDLGLPPRPQGEGAGTSPPPRPVPTSTRPHLTPSATPPTTFPTSSASTSGTDSTPVPPPVAPAVRPRGPVSHRRLVLSPSPGAERTEDDVIEGTDEVMQDAGGENPPIRRPVRLPAPATVPPDRPRGVSRRGPQELDDEQQRQVSELADQIVTAGLRDLRAGLRIPRTTVTAYGNERRVAAERARAVGLRRAQNVAGMLRAEIQRRLDLAPEAVQLVQRVRNRGVTAEDFPITVLSETRDDLPIGTEQRGTFFLSWSPRRHLDITVDRSPLSTAVERLEQLLPAAFGTDRRTFDPDRIASQLQFGPDQNRASPTASSSFAVDAPPGGRRELYELVGEAMAAGRATSVPALVAHHLVRQGLLSDATRVTAPDGKPLGRNWTGRPVRDIDTSSHYVVKGDQAKRQAPLWARGPAPIRPYVVGTAGGDHSQVELALPDGRNWTVSEDTFAHLLAADPDLGAADPDLPVVLVSPKAGDMGLDLPRKAAFRSGRTVWAHSGSAKLTFHPGTGQDRIEVLDRRESVVTPLGEWIDNRPDDLGPDPEADPASDGPGRIRTVDGEYIRDRDVKTVTLTIDGRPTGRGVLTDGDQKLGEVTHRSMDRFTHWYVVDPVTEEIGPPIPVPWKGRKVYFFELHGIPGHSEFVTHPGQRKAMVVGDQGAPYLSRRRSLRRLDKDVPIVLLSCWADVRPGLSGVAFRGDEGSPAPFVPDPLAVASVAEDFATETRRDVWAPNRVLSFWDDHSGGLTDTPDGTRVGWAKSKPRPTEQELDDLAEAAGLRAGPDLAPEAVRPTTLRLVRALRQTFGVDIENDKDDPTGTYGKLLQDIVALEKMRRADPNLRGTGEFTLDLLQRATRAHLGQRHTPGTRPPQLLPSDVRAFLDAASAKLASDPGAVLTGVVSLPTVDRARELIARHADPDALARDVLGLDRSADITQTERQNLLWATVKAVESVDNHPDADTLAKKVLHLRDGEDPRDAGRRTDLLWTAAAAAAVGRDTYDPTALAAHHLERNGALGPASRVLATNGTPVGRNWTRRPVPGLVVADRYRVTTPDGATSPSFRAPWRSRDATPDDHPGSYFLVMDPGSAQGTIDMPWTDGGTRPVPYDEIGHLLRHDPELAPLSHLDVGLVPVGLPPGELPLARALGARTATGRAVHLAEHPLRLVHDPSTRCARLEVTSPQPQPSGATVWRRVDSPARNRPNPTPAVRPSGARVVLSAAGPGEAGTTPTGTPPLRPLRAPAQRSRRRSRRPRLTAPPLFRPGALETIPEDPSAPAPSSTRRFRPGASPRHPTRTRPTPTLPSRRGALPPIPEEFPAPATSGTAPATSNTAPATNTASTASTSTSTTSTPTTTSNTSTTTATTTAALATSSTAATTDTASTATPNTAPTTSTTTANATSTSPPAPPSTPRPVWIGQGLDERRPPRLDSDLPPPPEPGEEVRFSDGTRLPVYMGRVGSVLRKLSDGVLRRSFTFGQSDRVLRGIDQVAAGLDAHLGQSGNRPRRGRAQEPELLSEVRRRLTRKPQSFFGDGQRFSYTTADGKQRVLHATARPYGHWERFAFGYANPVKIDAMQRFTTNNGRTGVHSTSGALVTSVPLGPAKGPVKPFGRLWGRIAVNKHLHYPMQNQTMSQIETRTTDGSHAHLDDVWYDFRVTDANGRPVDRTGRTVPPGNTSPDPFSFGFAMRHGLYVRLPDSLTHPQPDTARAGFPDTFVFGPRSNYRAVSTEGYGPVAHIRDWAVEQAGVAPGGMAGKQLGDFFSTEGFHRMSRVLTAGQVTTPPLFRDSSARDPIGVFSIRVRSVQAHLIDATTAAELRDIMQSTVSNPRILGKGRATDVGGMIGPSFQLAGLSAGKLDLRMLFGLLNVRYGSSRSRSVTTGGSGGVKSAAQAKGDPTGLYLVHKTVTVSAPPDEKAPPPDHRQADPDGLPGPAKVRKNPPEKWSSGPQTRTFETWSVERLTRTEARRLAGIEAPPRQNPAPATPPYLTENHPPTLGMSRVEEFTFDDGNPTRTLDGRERTFQEHFADEVLKATAKAYPGLVAPLDQLNPHNPRWRDAEHFQTVVNNTLEVMNALSYHSMAGNLETMATTGLPIPLVDSGRFRRAIRHVWIDAALTGRRYEGTQRDERLRFSAPGNENLGAAQSGARSADVGTEAQFSLRSSATNDVGGPMKAGTMSVGGRYGRRQDTESGHGAAATHEAMSIGTKGSHLHSYQITLTARRGGHWRLRGLLRGILSLNLLSLQPFVFVEPETTLIGTDPSGQVALGGEAVAGRVLLSIPTEHTPTTVRPAGPHRLHGVVLATTSRVARDLALRTRDLFDRATRPRENGLERHPHLTLAVVSHPGITQAAEEALHEASGGSWHVTQQGAPAHDSALRAFQSQYLTANFDQTSAPLGWRASGLWAKGPYTNRTTTLAHRTRIRPGSLTALTGAVPVDTETTVGGVGQAAGRATRTSTVFVGGQVVYLHSHETRPGVTGNYGVVASPYRLDRSRVRSVARVAVAEINRKDMGRQVLVSGDVDHEIAAASSAVGRGATGRRWVPRWLAGAAGRRLLVQGGWVGHVPEKNAHRMGLLDDGLGDVPLYTGRSWSPQPWLLDNPFGGFPVNPLNTAGVLADFDRKLRSLGLSSADRDTVHRLVTGRVARALGKEMVGAGASAAGRMGRWGSQTAGVWVGNRLVRTRAELIPVQVPRTGFAGLGHSVELEEHRQGAETVLEGRSRASGATVGLSVTEGVHTTNQTADIVRMAGPTFAQVGSTQQTTGQNTLDGGVRIATATTTQAHAEYVTQYRLRLTAEIVGGPERETDDPTPRPGDRSARLKRWADRQWQRLTRHHPLTRITSEGDVGEQVEHFPLSLMRPDPPAGVDESNDPLAPPRPDDPGEPRQVPVPASLAAGGWHAVRHPRDGSVKPFVLPEDGFKVRRITGLGNLHAANTLALASAYDASFSVPETGTLGEDVLARAMNTPLTRPGTGSAQNLEDGTTNGALTAFYGDTLTPGGHPVPGLTETGFLGGAHGELSMHSRPDFGAARLLAVTDGMKHEAPKRDLQGGGMSTSRVAATEVSLGGGPIVSSQQTGTNQIAGAPGDSTTDSEALVASGERLTSVNIKPNTTRSFLFAIPTTWLSVAGVHHHVKDSRAGQAVRGTFGNTRRGPQAMETRTSVLAWVREDVARDLGLIEDTGFPPKVAKAWDAVTKADKEWTAADKEYWNLRRDGRAGREAALRDAEAALAALEARDPDTLPGVMAVRDALALLDQDATDAEPAHEGWADLRDVQRQAAADRLAGELRAAADQVAAARDARDAAQARLAGLRNELDGLRTRAEALAEEYARVRTAADRLTRWHQLNATDEGRRRLTGTPEPDEVVFTPPPAPAKGAPDGKKADGKEKGSSATATAGGPGAKPRPAYGDPPWRPDATPDPTLRRFDAAEDHRALTATDPDGREHVYDLHPVSGKNGGNGFYAAVQLAMGHDQADADRLAARVALRSPLPADAQLDPQAVFHPRELNSRLGPRFRNDAGLHAEVKASGGLLPDSVRARLNPVQRERLVRLNLRKGRRWDAATADLAASLTAQTLGVDLTVVAEDGSYRYFPGAAPGATGPLPQVTLYQRGGSYLAARPRTGTQAPAPPVPPPVPGTAPGASKGQGSTASGTVTPVPPKATSTVTPPPKPSSAPQSASVPPPKQPAPPLPLAEASGDQVTVDGQTFAIHPVRGDGNCLPTAVLQSIAAQQSGSPAAAMNVRQLRDHAANWYLNSADAADARTRHSALNPLETLVHDRFRDRDSLLRLLRRTTRPPVSADQRAPIAEQLEDARRRSDLLTLAAGSGDRGLLTDLPRGAVRALVPTPRPGEQTALRNQELRLEELAQAETLRTEVLDLLGADENDAQANELWRRILASLPLQVSIELPRDRGQFQAAGYQGMVDHSLRSASMWQTPFYDEVPLILAGALGIDLVLVRPGGAGGVHIQHLNPGANGPTVYVYYNGRDHYETLAPAAHATTSRTTAKPARSSKKSTTAQSSRRPDQPTRDRLADFVRRHGASDAYAQRLAAGLSETAVARLQAALDGRLSATGPSSAPSSSSAPLRLAGPASAASSSSAPAASRAPVPGGGVRPVRPPSRSRVGFDRRDRSIGPAQLREIQKLAEETVTAGLRDMAAGLRAPRITVTGYGNDSNLRFWGRSDSGRQRAEAVAARLREEMQIQLQIHRRLLQAVTAWRGWDELPSDAFEVVTQDGGRDLGPDARFDGVHGPRARRQAVVRVERSDRAPVVDRLSELDPEHFGPGMRIAATANAVLHAHSDVNAPDPDAGSRTGSAADSNGEDVPDRLRQLLDLTAEAMAAGRATSVAALGAFQLRKQGLLSEATRVLAPDGTVQGRNWTGEPVRDLDTSTYDKVDDAGNATPVPSRWAEPGKPAPYVVAAGNGDHESFVLALPGDSRRWRVPTEQLAELLSLDDDLAALDREVPTVLASPEAGDMGLKLPRWVAARVGREVWAHPGSARVGRNQGTGRYRIAVEDRTTWLTDLPGDWIISRPDDLGPDPLGRSEDGLLEALDGSVFPDSQVKTVTLTEGGRPIGRVTLPEAELSRVMKDYKGSLSKVTTVGSVDPLTGRPHGTAKPVRWKGDNAYFGMFHGFPGISGVERQFRPTASIDGTQTGRFLNRRPSVERLAPDGSIVLLSCSGGASPGRGDLSGSPLVPHLGRSRGLRRFVADPLSPSARPVGQAVSTETRRPVFAAGAIVQIDIAGDGTIALMLLSTPAGDEADFHEYLPEPVGEELDAVVAQTGLGGLPGLGPERARETALRLVHALRQTFGVHVQDDKDDPGGGYQRLLRGIGALEGMRQRDGNMRDTGEFTLDLLDRVTRARLTGQPAPGVRPAPLDTADVRSVLEAASVHAAGDPSAVLSDFVSLPSVDRARELLSADGDPDARVRSVLGLPGTAPVTAEHRQDALWATVKAVESVENAPDADALTRKALHLRDTDDPREEGRRRDLLWLAARTAAVGRDPYNPVAVAAMDLRRRGALGPDSEIVQNGEVIGRNLTGRPLGRLITDRYVASRDGTARTGTPKAAPWSRSDSYYLVLPPGLPADEIAELLTHDPHLSERNQSADVVLIGGGPTMAQALADRKATARNVVLAKFGVDLEHDPVRNTETIVVADMRQGNDWRRVKPPPLGTGTAQPSGSHAPVITLGTVPGTTDTTSAPPENGTGGGEFDRRVLAVSSDRFLDAVAAVLEHDAPQVLPGTAAWDDTGPVTAGRLRDWLDRRLSAPTGPADPDAAVNGFEQSGITSLLDPDDMVTTGELARLSVELTSSQQAQAVLQGGRLQVREAGLTYPQQLRLLLSRSGEGGGVPFIEALAETLAAELGVRLRLVESSGGTLTFGSEPNPAVSLDVHRLEALSSPEPERS